MYMFDGLFADEMTCLFGSQVVRLSLCEETNYLKLEVNGNNPIVVYNRIKAEIDAVIAECMPSLHVIPIVAFAENGKLPAIMENDETTQFLPMSSLQWWASQTEITPLPISSGRRLDAKSIRKTFPQWIFQESDNQDFDAFLSYRWGVDSHLVELVFDRLTTKETLGSNDRFLKVFFDRSRLKVGDQFQEKFARCLLQSGTIVPFVSVAAMEKRLVTDEFKPETEDNVLIEWILAIEVRIMGY